MSEVASVGTMRIKSGGIEATPERAVSSTDSSGTGVGWLLPDPATELAFSGDPGAMVAALTIESAEDERHVARTVESTEEQIQDREEAAQVAVMRQKASDMRSQALASGTLGVAEGCLSIAAAAGDLKSSMSRGLEAGSKLVDSFRTSGDQLASATNEGTEASATQHEHAAGHARYAVDDADSDAKDAQKLLDAAIDFYREYSSAREQAKAAAAHRG